MPSLFGDEPDEEEAAPPTSALVSMLQENLGVPASSHASSRTRRRQPCPFQAEPDEADHSLSYCPAAPSKPRLFGDEPQESASDPEPGAFAAAGGRGLFQPESDEDVDSDTSSGGSASSCHDLASPPAEIELLCSLGWKTLGCASFSQLLVRSRQAKAEEDANRKKRKYDGSRRKAEAAARKDPKVGTSTRLRRGNPASRLTVFFLF